MDAAVYDETVREVAMQTNLARSSPIEAVEPVRQTSEFDQIALRVPEGRPDGKQTAPPPAASKPPRRSHGSRTVRLLMRKLATVGNVLGAITSSTSAGVPISASTIVPQRRRPGKRRCPGFLRKKVTVTLAGAAVPRISPVAPSTPLGTSTAQVGIARAFSASIIWAAAPSIGRESPAPNIASMTTPAPSRHPAVKGSTAPCHNAA